MGNEPALLLETAAARVWTGVPFHVATKSPAGAFIWNATAMPSVQSATGFPKREPKRWMTSWLSIGQSCCEWRMLADRRTHWCRRNRVS